MRKRKENQVVYILLCKAKRSFFIACGAEDTLRETYRHHIKMRREYSLRFLSDCAPERPCLFILEKIDPKEEANLMLVWLRILQENGYTSFNSPDLIEMSEDLYIDNKMAYHKRKNADLTQLLSCEGCLVPKDNKSVCPRHSTAEYSNQAVFSRPTTTRKRENGIRIRLSKEEHDSVRRRAQEHCMPMSHYIKMVAMNPEIYHVDCSLIHDHAKTIKQSVEAIDRITFTIAALNNYDPKDIASVVQIMEELLLGQNELLNAVKKQSEELKKKLKGIHSEKVI